MVKNERMNIKTNLNSLLVGAVALAGFAAVAEPTVMVNKVESTEPWTQVRVDYTLDGVDADHEYKVAFEVTLRGETRGITNAVAQLENKAYTQMIDTKALFGVEKVDSCAKARVLLFTLKAKSVQLWAGGPHWATCNVGATKPEEYGYYFWWGDTVGYVRNAANDGWVSVKDGSGFLFEIDSTWDTYNKTIEQLRSAGWVDAAGNLTMEHDAARVQWGGAWRMPTKDELDALIANTTREEVSNYEGTGVDGVIFRGKDEYAHKSIFIPAAGLGLDADFLYAGRSCNYWSSTPQVDDYNRNAYYYYRSGTKPEVRNRMRFSGLSIRPVR